MSTAPTSYGGPAATPPPPPPLASGQPRTWRGYLEAPLRRPWHVIGPLVASVALSLIAMYAIPRRYTSTTVILVEAEKAPEILGKGAEEGAKRLPTLQQEILSRTRLERILRELDPYPGEVGRQPLSKVIERMRGAIGIKIKGDDAFTIDFTHRDPRMAMTVANRLASLFIEESAQTREERAEGTTEFLESELAEARKALDAQEEKLRRFKEEHLGSLPEQLAANLATLQRLEAEQQGAADDLSATLKRLTAIESAQAGIVPPGAGVMGVGAPNPAAAPAPAAGPAAELAQLRAQLATLRSRYTDEHPDIRALQGRIAQLESAAASAPAAAEPRPAAPAGDATRSVREDVESRRRRQQDLARQIAMVEARVEATPRTEAELSTLTRDHQKLKEQYLALLEKKMGARMTQTLEQRWKGQVFRVIDPAHLPDRASFPNRLLLLCAGLGVGLLAGLGLALAAESMDVSVKSTDELAPLALPILAVFHHLDGGRTAPVAALRPPAPAAPPPAPPPAPAPAPVRRLWPVRKATPATAPAVRAVEDKVPPPVLVRTPPRSTPQEAPTEPREAPDDARATEAAWGWGPVRRWWPAGKPPAPSAEPLFTRAEPAPVESTSVPRSEAVVDGDTIRRWWPLRKTTPPPAEPAVTPRVETTEPPLAAAPAPPPIPQPPPPPEAVAPHSPEEDAPARSWSGGRSNAYARVLINKR